MMTVDRPDPATVYEAGGRRGALPSTIRAVHRDFRVWGPAFPIVCGPGDNRALHEAIYAAEAGSVLVADTGGAVDFGYWGELMTHAALTRGIAGLVIDGKVRDRDALVRLAFPVFSRGLAVRGTTKHPTAVPLGRPMTIGEVEIDVGDLVVGGADGVVIVAASDVASTLRRARERLAAETKTIEAVQGGAKLIDLLLKGTP